MLCHTNGLVKTLKGKVEMVHGIVRGKPSLPLSRAVSVLEISLIYNKDIYC